MITPGAVALEFPPLLGLGIGDRREAPYPLWLALLPLAELCSRMAVPSVVNPSTRSRAGMTSTTRSSTSQRQSGAPSRWSSRNPRARSRSPNLPTPSLPAGSLDLGRNALILDDVMPALEWPEIEHPQ